MDIVPALGNNFTSEGNIALLPHTHKEMQDISNAVNRIASSAGLRININNTKIMHNYCKATSADPTMVQQVALVDFVNFYYLGSMIDVEGGSKDDTISKSGCIKEVKPSLKH